MRNPLDGSPTLDTLIVFGLVFAVQSVLGFVMSRVAVLQLFALAPPVGSEPWALVTSIYAHADLEHLLVNAAALALVGFPLERTTTRARFHLYFVVTGAIAGAVQVVVYNVLGTPTSVLGGSGAVFALFGYAIAGNRLADGLIDRIDVSAEGQLLAFALVAMGLTLAMSSGDPQVALLAHFTGLFVGLVAGRLGVLSVGEEPSRSPEPENTSYK